MGLFAVARLAERHGVQVRLRPANPQGVSALVWLPDTVIEHTALPFPGRRVAQTGSGVSTLARRTPGQHGITRAGADGQSGNDHEDAREGLVNAGQQRVDWFGARRDRAMGRAPGGALGGAPADAPGGAPGGAGDGGQASSPGLPVRVPKASPLYGAEGRQPADTE
jgi:hypothetical protein